MGAILVILGRKAFGAAHARNVIVSIILFFVGIAVIIAAGFILGAAAAAAVLNNPGDPRAVAEAMRGALGSFLALGIAGAAIAGIAYILFTYALQLPVGRIVLFGAYAAGVTVQVAAFLVLLPAISAALDQAVSTGTFDIAAFSTLQAEVQLLNLIPSALYAFAYYLAWARVKRGEIPPPMAPAGPAPSPAIPPPGAP